uniref:N-alpha-acetyltransferase 60 n=1 Tax=Chrysotila carterae TaxID=13221 RepID=A0A7S4AYH2_CHRCT
MGTTVKVGACSTESLARGSEVGSATGREGSKCGQVTKTMHMGDALDEEVGGALPIFNEGEEVVFRESRYEDIPSLKELHLALFPVRYNDAFFERLYHPGNFTLVGCCARSGDVVAVASARVVDDCQRPLPDNSAYIMTLGVDEAFRRRHVGSRAAQQILHVLAARTTCSYAELHVKSANRAAISFYERLGFEPDPDNGYVFGHYLIDGQRWDALLLRYDLRGLRATAGRASSYYATFGNMLSHCSLL